VKLFGYFFPTSRAHGERLRWSADELSRGREVLARLRGMIAAGCFPFTDDPEDVRYSDFRDAFGDAEETASRIREKLSEPRNRERLGPFRALRGCSEAEGRQQGKP
jgi:hypothetical protein